MIVEQCNDDDDECKVNYACIRRNTREQYR